MKLPEGWDVKCLSDLTSKISDGIHKTPLYADFSKIYFINGNNLKNGSIVIQDSTKFVDEIDALNHKKDLSDRTLLMSINGTIGNLAYYRGENVVLGKSASYINVKNDVDLDFVYYFLSSQKTQDFYESELTGTTIRNLSIKSIKSTQMCIPPLPEQQKIAKILSTWDKAISTTEQLLANSQQQKKALMQQLLTGQRRLLDDDGVRFSGEWENIRLRHVLCEEKARNKKGSIERVLSVTNHSGFVLPEEQFSKRVASDDVSNYKVVRKGQYGYNPSRLNVGSFARLDRFSEGLLSPMYVVFSVDESRVHSDFFLSWMGSNDAKQRIEGSTQGSVRDSVGFDALGNFPFKLPPLKEQQKIAAVLSATDQEISTLQQQLATLKQEKKALMQQLLTGKVRVKLTAPVGAN